MTDQIDRKAVWLDEVIQMVQFLASGFGDPDSVLLRKQIIGALELLPTANAWTPASEPPDDSRKVWEVILHAPQTFEEHPGLAFCYGNEWRDGATGEAIPDAVCSTELPKPPEGG